MRADQLWMGDRGYANPPGIATVTSAGADVLVRYNRGSLPLYDTASNLIDVRGKLKALRKPCRPREWAAWVHPQGHAAIRGRLCALRLPPEKAEEARVRLRREQGNDVTAESLEMADFVVVFTTVPRERLSVERVLELYCLRWQIELSIKRDKSIAGLDRLPNFRADTIASWILAKLLLTQIARKIATPDVAFPPLCNTSLPSLCRPNRLLSTREAAGTRQRSRSPGASWSSSGRLSWLLCYPFLFGKCHCGSSTSCSICSSPLVPSVVPNCLSSTSWRNLVNGYGGDPPLDRDARPDDEPKPVRH